MILISYLLIYKTKLTDKTYVFDSEENINTEISNVNMKITSSAFEHNNNIPSKYTCDGENISPPLEFSDIPKDAKSLVLIVDDPDVPAEIRPDRMWIHWVMFNISADIREISENSNSGVKGKNSFSHFNYGGPCPPPQYEPSTHRYYFKLYALDVVLELSEGAAKAEVEAEMEGHILDKAELIGLYSRN